MVWQISGFGDEITDLFPDQLQHMGELGIAFIEIRQFQLAGGDKKVIVDATSQDLDGIAAALADAGMKCSAIGSPIGKYRIDAPFEIDLQRFRGSLSAARRLDAPYVRIFSYYPPEGGDIRPHRDEVMRRLRKLCEVAENEAPGVTLALENESDLYGETPEGCLDVLETVNSPNLGIAFDAGNFVVADVDPVAEAWPLLKNHVRYFHVKDANAEKEMVPAGRGVANWEALLKAAREEEIGDFLSLEPHLKIAASSYGVTGPELFSVAKKCLDEVLSKVPGSRGTA